MAPTVRIDNSSQYQFCASNRGSSGSTPSLPSNATNAKLFVPSTNDIIRAQEEEKKKKEEEEEQEERLKEKEIVRQKWEMLSRHMKTIKEKKNSHLMTICIKTLELSDNNKKIQMELEELREQTRKFLEDLKDNAAVKAPVDNVSPQIPKTSPEVNSTSEQEKEVNVAIQKTSPTLTTNPPNPPVNPQIQNFPNYNFLYNSNPLLLKKTTSLSISNFNQAVNAQPALKVMQSGSLVVPLSPSKILPTLSCSPSSSSPISSLSTEQEQITESQQYTKTSKDAKLVLAEIEKRTRMTEDMLKRYANCNNISMPHMNTITNIIQNNVHTTSTTSNNEYSCSCCMDDTLERDEIMSSVNACAENWINRKNLNSNNNNSRLSRSSSSSPQLEVQQQQQQQQLQQQEEKQKQETQNHMAKHLDLISNESYEKLNQSRKRSGSTSSTDSCIKFKVAREEELNYDEIKQTRRKTLSLMTSPKSSSSFSPCSDLAYASISQCLDSPQSPWFTANSPWNSNDGFEDFPQSE